MSFRTKRGILLNSQEHKDFSANLEMTRLLPDLKFKEQADCPTNYQLIETQPLGE
jgi:hypothetical protein